jgi:hypothetical protein
MPVKHQLEIISEEVDKLHSILLKALKHRAVAKIPVPIKRKIKKLVLSDYFGASTENHKTKKEHKIRKKLTEMFTLLQKNIETNNRVNMAGEFREILQVLAELIEFY